MNIYYLKLCNHLVVILLQNDKISSYFMLHHCKSMLKSITAICIIHLSHIVSKTFLHTLYNYWFYFVHHKLMQFINFTWHGSHQRWADMTVFTWKYVFIWHTREHEYKFTSIVGMRYHAVCEFLYVHFTCTSVVCIHKPHI